MNENEEKCAENENKQIRNKKEGNYHRRNTIRREERVRKGNSIKKSKVHRSFILGRLQLNEMRPVSGMAMPEVMEDPITPAYGQPISVATFSITCCIRDACICASLISFYQRFICAPLKSTRRCVDALEVA